MRPLGRRGSPTRLGVGIGYAVQIGSEALEVDGRCASEHGDGCLCTHVPVTTHGCKFPDRDSVSGDDEGLALIEAPHDFPAVVAQFPLRDLSGHEPHCSTSCYTDLQADADVNAARNILRAGQALREQSREVETVA